MLSGNVRRVFSLYHDTQHTIRYFTAQLGDSILKNMQVYEMKDVSGYPRSNVTDEKKCVLVEDNESTVDKIASKVGINFGSAKAIILTLEF